MARNFMFYKSRLPSSGGLCTIWAKLPNCQAFNITNPITYKEANRMLEDERILNELAEQVLSDMWLDRQEG